VWKSGLFGCFGCLVVELCDDLVLVGYQEGLYTLFTLSLSDRLTEFLAEAGRLLEHVAAVCLEMPE